MNGCPSENQWEAFVDGDLAPERMREMALHLDTCPRCRALVDEMIALSAELGALDQPELPSGLEARVMAAVRNEPVPSPAAHRRATLLASLFTVGVIAETAMVVLKAYGVTWTGIAAMVAVRWPGLLSALSTVAGSGRMLGEALASPQGWVIAARVMNRTPWVWPAFVTMGLGVILFARRLHTTKGVEEK